MSKLSIIIISVFIGTASFFCNAVDVMAGPAIDSLDRHALVIGVANYQQMPSVPGALKNAQRVAHTLENLDYKVTLLQDPSSAVLKKAFNKFVHQEGQVEERSLVVYYCGQAKSQTLPDGKQLGWIIPTDSPALEEHPRRFSQSAISTRMLSEFSKKIRSRYMIMLFDAAFAADMFSLQTPRISSFNPKNLQPVRQFIVAGSPGESMPEENVFSRAFVQGLSGEADIFMDRYITGTELAVFLANRVMQATKGQLKLQYGESGDSEATPGDYFFHQVETALPGSLFVQCQPDNARIKILNIKPVFHQGIMLAPGSYRLQVAADGFVTQTQSVLINSGREVRLKVALKEFKSQTVNTMGMVFRWVGQGRFRMGSKIGELGRRSDEQRHWVKITDGFWMQTTEVTVGQFQEFISQTGYMTEAQKSGGCWTNEPGERWQRRTEVYWRTAGPWMDVMDEGRDHYPVTCISWNDAVAFARWLSGKEGKLYRLPTEQQWEVACRAGTATPFYTGQCLTSSDANFSHMAPVFGACKRADANIPSKIMRTGALGKNPWGLSDMHGNAAEWCIDRYGPYGQIDGELSPRESPRNRERIVRGGHFESPADQCRSASRSSFNPGSAANVIGFRLTQVP